MVRGRLQRPETRPPQPRRPPARAPARARSARQAAQAAETRRQGGEREAAQSRAVDTRTVLTGIADPVFARTRPRESRHGHGVASRTDMAMVGRSAPYAPVFARPVRASPG